MHGRAERRVAPLAGVTTVTVGDAPPAVVNVQTKLAGKKVLLPEASAPVVIVAV